MRHTVQKSLFEDMEPGIYDATFQGTEGPHEGKFGLFLKWHFDIHHNGEDIPYDALTSDAFVSTSRCKAWRWAKALDPTLTAETPEWDDEQFIGTKVQVALEWQDEDNPGFLKIKEVYPKRS
jgi:hypothetical protein